MAKTIYVPVKIEGKVTKAVTGQRCSLFTRKATEFKAEIQLYVAGKRGNAKSLLTVLNMGLQEGTEVKIVAKGPDSFSATKELGEFLGLTGMVTVTK